MACADSVDIKGQVESAAAPVQSRTLATDGDSGFSTPLLQPLGFHETMTAFFVRFRAALESASNLATQSLAKCSSFSQGPGLYLFKRPIIPPSGGANPLATCGTCFHHCVLYVLTPGGQVMSLDFAPANGADTTSALLESVPARPCRNAGRLPSLAGPPAVSDSPAAGGWTLDGVVPGDDGALPMLYLGPVRVDLQQHEVQQALAAAEATPYCALGQAGTANCIQFADAAARILTEGAVQAAPLVYDVLCGEAPVMDQPLIMLMQMMTKTSWHAVCDGGPLLSRMLAALRAPTPDVMDTASARAASPAQAAAAAAIPDGSAAPAPTASRAGGWRDGFSFEDAQNLFGMVMQIANVAEQHTQLAEAQAQLPAAQQPLPQEQS